MPVQSSDAKSLPSGLGLLEYLTFFEDAGMEPIMAVWSGTKIATLKYDANYMTNIGYALGGTNLPEDELVPYIAQARDQVDNLPLLLSERHGRPMFK